MIEGVKLFCFGASYSVALASEVSGGWVSPRLRRLISIGFTAAGVLAHTLYIGQRALSDRICPLTTSYDSLLVLSWVLAVIYLFVHWHYPRVTVGIFALPLILGLIAFSAFLGNEGHRVLEGWARIWGPIHGALLAAGAIAVFVGFVAGVMYLVQSRRLKAKHLPSELVDLPSLELLERVNRQGITVAFPLLTVGLAIGLLLALEQRHSGYANISLFDPKVIFGFLVWVALALLLTVRSQPQFRGRKVALLTIMAFCLLLFTMVGVDLLMSSWHRAVSGAGAEKGVRNLLPARSEWCVAQKVPDTFFARGAS
jgi:ABC-type transport system involved in cytochrome c biogenesis permease subunit